MSNVYVIVKVPSPDDVGEIEIVGYCENEDDADLFYLVKNGEESEEDNDEPYQYQTVRRITVDSTGEDMTYQIH